MGKSEVVAVRRRRYLKGMNLRGHSGRREQATLDFRKHF